jgi:hypothetical protein
MIRIRFNGFVLSLLFTDTPKRFRGKDNSFTKTTLKKRKKYRATALKYDVVNALRAIGVIQNTLKE